MNYYKLHLLCLFGGFFCLASNAQESKLVGMTSFNGGSIFSINQDGSNPELHIDFTMPQNPDKTALLDVDGIIWGMTQFGGKYDLGKIFTITAAGQIKKVFDFNGANGQEPRGSLFEIGGKIWGMTIKGGETDNGVIFNINTDGTSFQKVHDFEGGLNGIGPWSNTLVESGGKVWGSTFDGGAFEAGIIFSLNLDGTGFEKNYDFSANLIKVENNLYGIETNGLFSLDLDGGAYTLILPTNTLIADPHSHLIELSGKLWGIGRNSTGSIFNVNIDGSDLNTVHEFDGGTNGAVPRTSLVESNGKLWGTTVQGGDNGDGIIYSIDTDGTNFTKVHDFEFEVVRNRETAWNSQATLIESNGTLWGMTTRGGRNDHGVIYSFDPVNLDFSVVSDFVDQNGSSPHGNLIYSEEKLWGMTKKGGEFDTGVIFNINADGTNYTKILNLGRGTARGRTPYGSLVDYNDKFWGMTYDGMSGDGGIFYINKDGTGFTVTHKFSEFDDTDGSRPFGNLVEIDGDLWGMTSEGGDHGGGTLFYVPAGGNSPLIHHHFEGPGGAAPGGNLVLANSKVWGMTSAGGSLGFGTIFNINTNGTGFTHVHSFDRDTGRPKRGSLIEFEGKLWGQTAGQGNENAWSSGDIFSINLDGTGFNIEQTLGSDSATGSQGSLVEIDGALWGMSLQEVGDGFGSIYSYDGSTYTLVHNFTGEIGGNPTGDLLLVKSLPNLSFSVANKEATYGQAPLSLEATSDNPSEIIYSSSNPEVITISGATATIAGAGNATITASQEETQTYYASSDEENFSISKANLLATADDKNKAYGEDIPELTITYTGLVSSDSESDLDVLPDLATSATATSNTGEYEISVSGGDDNNYEISRANGVLTITKASQSISFDDLPVNIRVDSDDFDLSATATSQLPVVFTSEAPDIVSILGNTVSVNTTVPNEVNITANQSGNDNFEPAESVTQTLTIAEVLGILEEKSEYLTIYPNPSVNYFSIKQQYHQDYEGVYLVNIYGETIKEYVHQSNNRYEMNNLTDGVYLVIIKLNKQVEQVAGRLIVKQ